MERLLRQEEEELLFKGKKIHCRKNPLFKGRGDSLVYSGYLKKAEDSKEEIAVRKIKVTDCADQWKDIFNKHTREKDFIKHDNVLKIISYEEMDEWRYFSMERYDATLEQFCKGIYRGPMPSDTQVLFQITNGLLYLHAEQWSHGNLTPRTVLIASAQSVRTMIKLSEFGLSKFVGQCDGELGEEQEDELCQKKYWRLDGTTDNNQTPTSKHYNQDIFAAGCLCFYFLTRGAHPFGSNLSSILENIKQRNPVNLKTVMGMYGLLLELAYEPIENMIGDPPTDGKSWLLIAKTCFMKALPLRFEEENELGSGTFGVVYRGTFEGNAVAVKVFKDHLDVERKKEQKREMEEHLRLDHENVLKLLHVDELRDKTCLVLELCAGTLTQCIAKEYNGPMPQDGLVLYQIANGLHYIHSRNLVHRDVKPDNILISLTTPVQMKLSDFGFVKKISPQGTFTQQSGLKGTLNWMAPEILELMDDSVTELPHGTIQSDTFAAGCVFFYFLTGGKHPFGNSVTVPGNVLQNKPVNWMELVRQINSPVMQGLYELIGKMIKPIEQRISFPDVIEQLTTKLYASRQFKKFRRSVSELRNILLVNRFHPTEPILACLVIDKVILLSADNSSIPFSNWKEKETQLELGNFDKTTTMEWNVDGTQLAAASHTVIVCWSYPSGEILFQQTILNELITRIEWNPFRPNVFAVLAEYGFHKIFLFNSCPVDQRSFHFYTIESDATSVQWISANRVALGLRKLKKIEIWEIDESMTSAKIVKRLEHEGVRVSYGYLIRDMVWDERTKCLAACSAAFLTDGWMTIWSMDSDQPIHVTKVDGYCCRLAWRPNGKQTDDEGVDAARKSADNFILAGGMDKGRILIWTPLDSKEKTRILSQHSGWVDLLSFSPNGRFLASADDDGKLIIWTTENWEPVYIGKVEIHLERFSWLSSSTDVPDYKLTFNSIGDQVCVIEYAVGQCEKPGKD